MAMSDGSEYVEVTVKIGRHHARQIDQIRQLMADRHGEDVTEGSVVRVALDDGLAAIIQDFNAAAGRRRCLEEGQEDE